MASGAQQGHVYGPSVIDGNAHVQNGDHFDNRVEQHNTTVTYAYNNLHSRYTPSANLVLTG